jgi:hypothetical protein
MFFHQSDQFVTDFCTVITKNCCVITQIALLFGINCTEINQSQSSNILMYIISAVNTKLSLLFGHEFSHHIYMIHPLLK